MWRRQFIVSSGALAIPGALAAQVPTPAQSRGPFYPVELPLDRDSDLVQVTNRGTPARGTVLHLSGRILDLDARAVEGALVEIWQCDSNGRYHHPRDRGEVPVDPGFQGYGSHRSGPDGVYRFRTIRPVPYPGRTPHIHFAITAPAEPTLVTQMYVHGEPGNARDFLYGRIPQRLRDRVTVSLEPLAGFPGELAAQFDIVLPG